MYARMNQFYTIEDEEADSDSVESSFALMSVGVKPFKQNQFITALTQCFRCFQNHTRRSF